MVLLSTVIIWTNCKTKWHTHWWGSTEDV